MNEKSPDVPGRELGDQAITIAMPLSATFTAYFFFLIIPLFLIPLAFSVVIAKKLSWLEVAAFIAAGLVTVGSFVFWINYYFARLADRIELGESLLFRTRLREWNASWNELARFVVREPNSPFHGLSVINVMLTDGTKLAIWTKTADAEAALALVRQKPWARDLPGKPLELTMACLILLLGVIAVAGGLAAGYMLLEWYLEQRQDFLPLSWRFQLSGAVCSPLPGAGAIVFAIRHLRSRPIWYRPEVMRSIDALPVGIWDRIKKLFVTPE